MVSKKKIKQQNQQHFTLRGLENTRIESLSDGVFAIAIGLLLISTTPPSTYEELKVFTREFIPFGFTITLLMYTWYQHYIFFIRYGLRDAKTVAINTALLFLILFYVYPLKFLFSLLVKMYEGLIFDDKESLKVLFSEVIKPEDTLELMTLYGLGTTAVFAVLVLLNFRALRKKDFLGLSKVEITITQNTIAYNSVAGAIPLLSAFIALTGLGGKTSFVLSGMTYMIFGIAMPIVGVWASKRLERSIENKS